MAHSPYTERAVAYVAAHPGCCKYALARHLARRVHPSRLYRLVNTQIRLKNIVAVRDGRQWRLYLPDRGGPCRYEIEETPGGCPTFVHVFRVSTGELLDTLTATAVHYLAHGSHWTDDAGVRDAVMVAADELRDRGLIA